MEGMEVNQIIHGDCLEQLKTLEDNSVDSVVTDPPYGLSREPDIREVLEKWLAGEDYTHRGSGFMGKTWDSFVPGPAIWREVYRVLKPGGHALVFAGTRTQDLMTISLRLAGFEIRDVIEWLYFCLSEDTEILTCHGWVTYDKIEPSYKIACFNMETGKIEAHTPEAINIAPYSGDMIRLVSGETDQLVTPNHRLVIFEDGKYQFRFAREAKGQEKAVCIANEKELYRVWRGILGANEVSGGEEQVLLQRLQKEGESLLQQGKKTAGRTSRIGQDQLQCMRERGLEAKSLGEKDTKSGLLKGMQWETSDSSNFWGGSFKSMDGREEATITGEDEGGEQSILEGRGDASPFKRKLQGRDLCSVPGRVQGDGPERWVCDGASSNYGDGDWEATETNRGCSSHQPRSARQPSGEPGVVGEQCRPQITRSRKDGSIQTHLSAASKKVAHYDGVVWCVTVPTGAFVARRNGRIFVTGNSGFPKSMDVSKAIDKKLGADREVTGQVKTRDLSRHGGEIKGDMLVGVSRGSAVINVKDKPATEEAKQWQGWGTALKPAHEPIILARKPLDGTVVDNVERWGTGAINVDACRIGDNAGWSYPNGRGGSSWHNRESLAKNLSEPIKAEKGRFPANCVTTEPDAFFSKYFNITPPELCKKASKQDRNSDWRGELIDLEPKNHMRVNAPRKSEEEKYATKRANNHPTVKPTDLMAWLVRLITPPGGIVLDPFAGSGTTGVAAKNLGFNYILIEKQDEYIPIIKARLSAVQS